MNSKKYFFDKVKPYHANFYGSTQIEDPNQGKRKNTDDSVENK